MKISEMSRVIRSRMVHTHIGFDMTDVCFKLSRAAHLLQERGVDSDLNVFLNRGCQAFFVVSNEFAEHIMQHGGSILHNLHTEPVWISEKGYDWEFDPIVQSFCFWEKPFDFEALAQA